MEQFSLFSEFLLQFDALKTINRRTHISGGQRLENSAEHSWHLAIACWGLAQELEEDYDLQKLMQLALVHDLGEIEAGDTFLYDPKRTQAHIAERQCVEKLAGHPGNPIGNLVELWQEQEEGVTQEAKLLKAVDRLLPFLHNLASEGRAWRDHGIHKDQVLQMHQFIKKDFPSLFLWIVDKIDFAVKEGWLRGD